MWMAFMWCMRKKETDQNAQKQNLAHPKVWNVKSSWSCQEQVFGEAVAFSCRTFNLKTLWCPQLETDHWIRIVSRYTREHHDADSWQQSIRQEVTDVFTHSAQLPLCFVFPKTRSDENAETYMYTCCQRRCRSNIFIARGRIFLVPVKRCWGFDVWVPLKDNALEYRLNMIWVAVRWKGAELFCKVTTNLQLYLTTWQIYSSSGLIWFTLDIVWVSLSVLCC